jgi:tRNA(Ile)-lysidine synthase
MLARLAGSLEHVGHRHLENILQMVSAARPNLRNNLPGGLVAVREYDTLVIRTPAEITLETAEITIPGPGSYQLPGGAILRVEFAPLPVNHGGNPSTACFDGDRMPFPWHVRTFRPGDRIQPLGMSGRKKVKDIFIDEKIPLARRALTPLVFCGGELIWIVGLRISHLARVDSLSSRVVTAAF